MGNFIDLTGQTFGRLIVIKRTEDYYHPKNRNQPQFLCRCICGNEKIVRGDSLRRGATVSCGCEHESFLATQLKEYYKNKTGAILEYRAVKNPNTNQWLRYDIYIPSKNIFIEIQGIQHSKLGSWHIRQSKRNDTSPEIEFMKQKQRDRIKRKYAKENGFYIELNILKYKTFDKAIAFINNKINMLGLHSGRLRLPCK